MRTTVEYEDDLMRDILEKANREGSSMKEVLNRTLARGLGYCAESTSLFVCPTKDLGQARLDIDSSLKIADGLEDEAIGTKLELNK
jgi:hypothetical protein